MRTIDELWGRELDMAISTVRDGCASDVYAMDLVHEMWHGHHPCQANGMPPLSSSVTIEMPDTIPTEVLVTVQSPTLSPVTGFAPDLRTAIGRAYLRVVGWTPIPEGGAHE